MKSFFNQLKGKVLVIDPKNEIEDVTEVKSNRADKRKAKKFKGALSYIKALAVAAVILSPSYASAANEKSNAASAAGGSPQGPIQSVIDGIMNLLLILAPSVGTLALITFGIQYYFAKEHSDKASLRENMKATGWITVLIFIASGTIKWIVSLAS